MCNITKIYRPLSKLGSSIAGDTKVHLRNESRRRTRKTGAEEIIEMMGEKLLLTAVNVGTAGMTMRLITLMFNSLAPSLKVFWPSKKILTFL